MKIAISLNRVAKRVCRIDDKNITLIPIEQGSTNPIKPKVKGNSIDPYQDMVLHFLKGTPAFDHFKMEFRHGRGPCI
jgi:hypothetical protein